MTEFIKETVLPGVTIVTMQLKPWYQIRPWVTWLDDDRSYATFSYDFATKAAALQCHKTMVAQSR